MGTFQSAVDKLLDQVDTLYSQKYKQEITSRLHRLWNKQPATDKIPYVVLSYEPPYDQNDPNLSPWENEVIAQLHGIINHKVWNDDYIPIFYFGIIQALIPSCFGCTQVYSQDKKSVEVVPVIKEHQDIHSLKPLGFDKGTLGGDMLEKMRFFHKATHGRILLAETDMQGPFSVASQIWGIESFLAAIYKTPEAVHHLLDLTTQVIIDYIRLMFEVTEGNLSPCHCMPYLWMSKDQGVCVSEDLLAVVSPEITEQFIVPYLNKIGKAFGGVLAHTCGSLNHGIKALAQTPYVIGVNCSSSETHLEKLVHDGGKELVYLIHSSPVAAAGLKTLNCIEQLSLFKECIKDQYAGICQVTPYTTSEDIDMMKVSTLLNNMSFLK